MRRGRGADEGCFQQEESSGFHTQFNQPEKLYNGVDLKFKMRKKAKTN